MDMLRSAVSVLGHFDPDTADSTPAANMRKSERLLGQIAVIIGTWARTVAGDDRPVRYDADLSHAGNLLQMILGEKPDDQAARAMDVSLILYAEHEFNASTFAARVTTGTMADMHAAITSAIGTLKGPLHGGANEAATHMLLEIGSPDNAEAWLATALKEKKKIMGFGHRVYKHGDHRAKILKGWSRKVAQVKGDTKWIDISDIIEAGMDREKNIFPNLDFPCASLFYVMGLPIDLYTPLFVASRITGWCAHVMEQTQDNRLIRPTSEYIGHGVRKVVPIDQR
jgi:citrate synthase